MINRDEINYLTGSEVARRAGVTPQAVPYWVRQGYLRRFKIGLRMHYREDDVQAFLEIKDVEVPIEKKLPARSKRAAAKASRLASERVKAWCAGEPHSYKRRGPGA